MLWLRNNYTNLTGINIFFVFFLLLLGVGNLGRKKIIDLWKLEVRRKILPKHNSILQRGKKKLTMSSLCQWKVYDLLRVEKEADLSLPMPEG